MEFEKAKWSKFKRAISGTPWGAYREWQKARRAMYEAAPEEHKNMVYTADVFAMGIISWGLVPYIAVFIVGFFL